MWYLVTKKQFDQLETDVIQLMERELIKDRVITELGMLVASIRDEITGLKNNIQNQKDVIDMIVSDMARPKAEQRNSQAVSLSEYHDLIEELIFTNRFTIGEKIGFFNLTGPDEVEIIQMPQRRAGLKLMVKFPDGSIKSFEHKDLKYLYKPKP